MEKEQLGRVLGVIRFVHTRPWPHPKRGPFNVDLEFQLIAGGIELVGFGMRSYRAEKRPDDVETLEPITAVALRQVRIGQLIREGIEDVEDSFFPKREELLDDEVFAELAQGVLEALESRKRDPRGRKGYGPEHYIEVGGEYSRALNRKKKPTEAVADRWGVSKSTAAKWVSRSRQLGFLPPTTRGKPKGAINAIVIPKPPTVGATPPKGETQTDAIKKRKTKPKGATSGKHS